MLASREIYVWENPHVRHSRGTSTIYIQMSSSVDSIRNVWQGANVLELSTLGTKNRLVPPGILLDWERVF